MPPSSRVSLPFLAVLAVVCLLLVCWGRGVAERARGPVARLGAGLLGCPELACGASAADAGGERSAPAEPYRLHVRADLPGVDADTMFRRVVAPAQKAGAALSFVLASDSTSEDGVCRMHFAAAGRGYLNLVVSREDDDSPAASVKESAVVRVAQTAPTPAEEPAVVKDPVPEETPVSAVAPTPAEEIFEPRGSRWPLVVVVLADGSRLEGELRRDALTVDSETLGRLSLPISSLSRAEAGEAGDPWLFETHSGDELRVRPVDETLPLSTDFGDVSVPVGAVKSIEFPKG